MKNKSEGFSIMEVVVVIGIIAICGGILIEIFIGQNRIYKLETAELNITNDARNSLDDIDNYIRQSTLALSSYTSYTASATTLILQIQSVNSSNQLIAGTYDTVVFYLSGSNLFRQVFPAVGSSRLPITKKIAENITGLVFTYNNVDFALVTQVSTDLTIAKNAGVVTKSITVSSDARLRNY